MYFRWLPIVPLAGILLGIVFVNRVEPLVLGMPLALAWIELCTLLTSVTMALVYCLDPENRNDEDATDQSRREQA